MMDNVQHNIGIMNQLLLQTFIDSMLLILETKSLEIFSLI